MSTASWKCAASATRAVPPAGCLRACRCCRLECSSPRITEVADGTGPPPWLVSAPLRRVPGSGPNPLSMNNSHGRIGRRSGLVDGSGYRASVDERTSRLDIHHVWCNLRQGVGDTEFCDIPSRSETMRPRRGMRAAGRVAAPGSRSTTPTLQSRAHDVHISTGVESVATVRMRIGGRAGAHGRLSGCESGRWLRRWSPRTGAARW